MDLRAGRGYEPLLDAIRYTNAHRDKPVLYGARSRCYPRRGVSGLSISKGSRRERYSRRCGSRRGTREEPEGCIAPAAAATVTRPTG